MGPRLSCRLLLTACAFSLALPQATAKPQVEIPLHSVQGPDVTLHYVSVGRGQPVVMVHGGLEDIAPGRLNSRHLHHRITVRSPTVGVTISPIATKLAPHHPIRPR